MLSEHRENVQSTQHSVLLDGCTISQACQSSINVGVLHAGVYDVRSRLRTKKAYTINFSCSGALHEQCNGHRVEDEDVVSVRDADEQHDERYLT